MKASGRKVTFEVAMTLAHHREQLGQKCTAIQHMLAGRKQVLLPEGRMGAGGYAGGVYGTDASGTAHNVRQG